MTEAFVQVAPEQTGAEALATLRQAANEVETLSDLYMLDNPGRLTGVVTLRALLLAPPGLPLSVIAVEPAARVTPETDQEEVARLVPRDLWRVVGRELLLGLLLGVAGFGLAFLLGNGADLALVVGLTVVAICTWANTIGAMVPLLAYRLGLDPALVSAPLIMTLVDATGLAIYLLIARFVLGL